MGLFSFLTGKKKEDAASQPVMSPAVKPAAKASSKPKPKHTRLSSAAYTAMAIETASKSSKSICRIAFIAFDKNSKEQARDSIYVKPAGKTFSFSDTNGITAADVADAPSFKDVWPRIEPYVKDSTVAVHYARFVIKCLSACLKDAGVTGVSCNFIDTHSLGKTMFPKLEEHRLEDISIEVEGHVTNPKDTMSKALAISDIVSYARENKPRVIKDCVYSMKLS